MEKKSNVWGKIFRIVGDVLIGILVFAFLLSGVLVLAVGNITSEDTVAEIVENADLYEIYGDFANDVSGTNVNLTEELSELIVDAEQYNITKKSVKKLVESKEVKEFLTDTLTEYIQALADGGEVDALAEDDVIDLFRDLEKRLPKAVGFGAQWDYDAVKEMLDEVDFENFSIEAFFDEAPEELVTSVRFVKYLIPAAIALFVLSAALLALIWVINRKHLSGFFYAGGISVFLAGLFSTAIFLVLGAEPEFLQDVAPEGMISRIIEILNLPGTASYVVLAVGALMIAAAVILTVVQKKKNKKSPTPTAEPINSEILQ